MTEEQTQSVPSPTIPSVEPQVSIPDVKVEECKPCKLNIGAAMMVATCKEIRQRDGDNFDIDCAILEKELVEKEDKVAESIIEQIHSKVMEKGNAEDKDIVQELYDLAHGKK